MPKINPEEAAIKELEQWSSIYEFSFQFWGAGNNNVFIAKSGIDLTSFGGCDTIGEAIKDAVAWCNKQNPK